MPITGDLKLRTVPVYLFQQQHGYTASSKSTCHGCGGVKTQQIGGRISARTLKGKAFRAGGLKWIATKNPH